jgi:hypothetical protein
MVRKNSAPQTVDGRKEIFQAVVDKQDQGVGAVEARAIVARRFGVSQADVRQIEEEGLQGEWPPL